MARAQRHRYSHVPLTANERADRMATTDDMRSVEALRAGDERAFAALVDAYGAQMLRIAMFRTPTRAAAEDVVQDTWIGVLNGLDRFEGRSSLKTWVLRILVNRAITRGARERRTVPRSSLGQLDEAAEPAVAMGRFQDALGRYPGHWAVAPTPWDELPEERLLSEETVASVRAAIDALPPAQRAVVTLRDVDGWTSREVCNALGLTETNQRVLLHRGRSSVRRALERSLEADRSWAGAAPGGTMDA
jgi:RNA polymerase sigma-70 factor (ECF subfamily)